MCVRERICNFGKGSSVLSAESNLFSFLANLDRCTHLGRWKRDTIAHLVSMDMFLADHSGGLLSRVPDENRRGRVSVPRVESPGLKTAEKKKVPESKEVSKRSDNMKTIKEKAKIVRESVSVDAHELNRNTRSIKAQSRRQRKPKKNPNPRLLGCLHLGVYDHVKTGCLLFLYSITFPLFLALAILLTIIPRQYIMYLLPSTATDGFSAQSHRNFSRAEAGFKQRTVLVTGVGMTKGLTLARSFWLCGHRVVAADFNANRCGIWTPWKGWTSYTFSRAFDAVYSLRRPAIVEGMVKADVERTRAEYVHDICSIVIDEDVDLWVSCSGVASAVEDALVMEALSREKKRCACIQFDVPTTSTLHEKSSFIRHTKDLGLLVPETHDVVSQGDVLRALAEAKKVNPARKFILKPVGMDDANRGNMTLLPLAKPWETEAYVRQLPISEERPWILQQFISGGREYCTHSVVVNGQVKVFTACPSSELLMHYQKLAGADPLHLEMYNFTTAFAKAGAEATSNFTGHLSFDFMAEDDGKGGTHLYAIECNPRAHTAVVLFANPGVEMRMMVKAYLSAMDAHMRNDEKSHAHDGRSVVAPPGEVLSRYWLGHDIVTLVLLPLLGFLTRQLRGAQLLESVMQFVDHTLRWKDGTFELWDPWPVVALYFHYWPKAVLSAWWKGQRWSRLNVSTTKMFAC